MTRRALLDRDAARVAIIWFAVDLVLIVLLLVARGDVMAFVEFGADEPVTAHASEVFGDDLVTRGPKGHDGQVFWALAHDPVLVHPDRVEADLDRPAYRAQRVLYPAAVAPWRLAGEHALLWGLLVTNLAVVLLGGYVTARLAIDIGAPVRAGLVFALNPLVIMAIALDVADAMALAAVVAFVLAVARRQWTWAVVAAVVAVLTKESSYAAVAAVAVLVPGLPRPRRIAMVAAPAAAALAWGGYVRWRLGWPTSDVNEFTAIPFRGFADTLRLYYPDRSALGDVAVMFTMIPLAAWIVVRWWQRRTLAMTAALPFALIVPFLAAPVLYLPLNSVRAIGPALTFLAIDLYAAGGMSSVSRRRAVPAAAR